jgi:hypothetical protein
MPSGATNFTRALQLARPHPHILVQVIKAKHLLQLLNPAAPSQYGSGWDNIEWFPASANGPRLKLFSLSF